MDLMPDPTLDFRDIDTKSDEAYIQRVGDALRLLHAAGTGQVLNEWQLQKLQQLQHCGRGLARAALSASARRMALTRYCS